MTKTVVRKGDAPQAASEYIALLEAAAASLTPREHQSAVLFMKGLNDRQAAERLGLSKRTVEGYRLRLYRKFGVCRAADFERLFPLLALLPAFRS